MIDSRTWALLFAWIARRSTDGHKPGLLARMSRPDWCGLTPGRLPDAGGDVEEMGWCFLDLPGWQQVLLWNWCVMGASEWKEFSTILRYSDQRLRRIVWKIAEELEESAVSKGIVTLADVHGSTE